MRTSTPRSAAFADLHAAYTTEQLEFLIAYQEASIAITTRETDALRALARAP